MAKQSATKARKSLVIVESPTKARTISKFLGDDFTVEASYGHVRDLPEGKKDVPEEFKRESWARLGVNVDDQFTPIYIVPEDKRQHVAKLRKLLAECGDLWLATDEDREGEAISWHLQSLLKPKVPVHRLVFHEITREAIQNALASPRQVDESLVRAQETRRILDRLYGYEVSELLWRKVGNSPSGKRLSAGRVQSVAVRLIVERERQRRAFVRATYWDLLGRFASAQAADAAKEFEAAMVSLDGRRVPRGDDFDDATGKLKNPELLLLTEADALALAQRLQAATFVVEKVEVKPDVLRPAAPFITSSMQVEANRKLGFTAVRAMRAAQNLYENGYITYMRTDSTNLAAEAVEAARDLVRTEYGPQFLPPQPRVYKSKVKNAQEAHEAIRPAGHPFRLPQSLKNELNPDEYRLFELIWKRTIASQMVDAQLERVTLTLAGGGARFQVSGKSIKFPGFLRAYVEGSDDPDAELADRETLLPAVREGERLTLRGLQSKSHTTQPPARFTEAALTQRLEDMGIGRPSTYATIIETIQSRDYVYKKGNALVPSWTAFAVARLLEEHLPKLIDYEFTAQMEEFLDAISRREAEHVSYLRKFYFGNGSPGLKQEVEDKKKTVDPSEIGRFSLGVPASGAYREEVFLRVGKFGPFLQQGERKAAVPADLAPDEMLLDKALELLDNAQKAEAPLGHCPATGKAVFLKRGRFGPYVQLASGGDDDPAKNASLLKNMRPEDVTVELALKLLSLPRQVGASAASGEPIQAFNGQYGPYIKCGKETRSLPENMPPFDVTLEQCEALLAQPKTRRGRGAPREPLRVFEASPVTGQAIQLFEGRYGPYVTDGVSNQSVPRGTAIEAVTFAQAVEWLAERAAKAPPTPKKATKKAATKKKSSKTKAAPGENDAAADDAANASAAASASSAKSGAKKTSAKKAALKKAASKAAPKKAAAKKAAAKPTDAAPTTDAAKPTDA